MLQPLVLVDEVGAERSRPGLVGEGVQRGREVGVDQLHVVVDERAGALGGIGQAYAGVQNARPSPRRETVTRSEPVAGDSFPVTVMRVRFV